MEHPQLPNPDQQRLKWVHFTLPENVIPLPRPVPEVEHDNFAEDLPLGILIEFPTKEDIPDQAA